MTSTTYPLGTTATYSCSENYIFTRTNELERICTDKMSNVGEWNGSAMECVEGE